MSEKTEEKYDMKDKNVKCTNSCKIKRPPNAFILFSKEYRKKLSIKYPKESNRDISRRLGLIWSNTEEEMKEKFYFEAEEIAKRHKDSYPGYIYNPNERRPKKSKNKIDKKSNADVKVENLNIFCITIKTNGENNDEYRDKE